MKLPRGTKPCSSYTDFSSYRDSSYREFSVRVTWCQEICSSYFVVTGSALCFTFENDTNTQLAATSKFFFTAFIKSISADFERVLAGQTALQTGAISNNIQTLL